MASHGFYVLVDNHLREDQTALQNQDLWIANWVTLASAIAQDPVAKEKVMLDLLNEPDNFGIRWERTSNRPALADLYLKAMDALHDVYPGFLFFYRRNGPRRMGANWGMVSRLTHRSLPNMV